MRNRLQLFWKAGGGKAESRGQSLWGPRGLRWGLRAFEPFRLLRGDHLAVDGVAPGSDLGSLLAALGSEHGPNLSGCLLVVR